MSTQAAASTVFKPSPFRELLVLNLLPYFACVTKDIQIARGEILETLAAYGARTRSELIIAARIVAFGLSSLHVLSEANDPHMPHDMQLRHRNCANALDRSCRQVEKALSQTLACDVPGHPETTNEPVNDMPDAEVKAALQETNARIEACRNRLSGNTPTHRSFASRSNTARPSPGSALLDVLAQAMRPEPSAAPA